MAQLVKCLLCKQDDLSLIPRNHMKKTGNVASTLVIPALWEWRQKHLWLIGLPGKFQAMKDLSPKTRWTATKV